VTDMLVKHRYEICSLSSVVRRGFFVAQMTPSLRSIFFFIAQTTLSLQSISMCTFQLILFYQVCLVLCGSGE
jgi:hypothetical protein